MKNKSKARKHASKSTRSAKIQIDSPRPATLADGPQEWRLRKMILDPVTGFPVLPSFEMDVDLLFDARPTAGVIFLQIGKFSGLESAYGWELFDEILRVAAHTILKWKQSSEWNERVLSMHFNGVDGFYLLVSVGEVRSETPHLVLELLGHQLRDRLLSTLGEKFSRPVMDLLGVFYGTAKLQHDPQVRTSRHLFRVFNDVARAANRAEHKEQTALEQEFRNILTQRRIHTVFQPIFHLPNQQRVGYEALSRGPEGSVFESPETLFATARENSLLMELEAVCQASAFNSLLASKAQGRLFVNTSSNFISHPIFRKRLKDHAFKKLASSLVLEITEKEAIENYHDFRREIEPVRKAGIRIAVDDAGSGYADLESIAEVKPEYIKIANSITHHIGQDLIKQEIVSSFLGLARKLRSTVIAEGIETREDFHVLKRIGVEFGQGFFLGRPGQLVAAN